MIIPCIDLMDGKVVQLVQGERKAIERYDLDALLDSFEPFPLIHVIDLDAAKGTGSNVRLVESIVARRKARVGGGVRSAADARSLIDAGAHQVIIGSSAFTTTGVDAGFLSAAAEAVGAEILIAAVDSLGGKVAVQGWRRCLELAPIEAIPQMAPFVGGFLCTYVDREGMLQGTDIPLFLSLRRITDLSITAAGGITTLEEVETLLRHKVSVALGMAIYTGRLPMGELVRMSDQVGTTAR